MDLQVRSCGGLGTARQSCHDVRRVDKNGRDACFPRQRRMFFDKNVDRYLPVAIAQGSIFWLYVTYVYCFLPCKLSH